MTIGNSPVSRRDIASAAGVAAVDTAASLVHASAQADQPTNEPSLRNPADRYPKPPYKKQSQPWPGLASKMDPRPDHGETSYRGSGRLAGRKALITGGEIGRAHV